MSADELRSLQTRSIRPAPGHGWSEVDARFLVDIWDHGIQVPLLVRPIDDWHGDDLYEVVDGHRRLAAAKTLALETVPVVIRELTNEEASEVARTLNFWTDANATRKGESA